MAELKNEWLDLGTVDELIKKFSMTPLFEITQDGARLALSYREGVFGAVSGICNHLGGPLGKGTLDGDYIVCPWHYWKFHRATGDGEPGYEKDHVPHHPCSITQMDEKDELDRVYEALVHWADVICVATPIRWGSASSLYYKMAERLNCIQNAITTHNNVLIKNKVICFVITGGQDNVQAVAGQMLGFFFQLGFVLPPFPYVAHSLGWTAENMERNVKVVVDSQPLRDGTRDMIRRAAETYRSLAASQPGPEPMTRGGRKAFNCGAPTTS